MNKNFFKTTKILDGGMGQELLARGMEPKGTLWSANALIEEKYHDLILNIHNDFIKSGADVIVTTTFTTRRKRLRENGIEDQFKFLNQKACEIAQKAKLNNPHIKIAGGLPPQDLTYEEDKRSEKEITKDHSELAEILNPSVDFFYFDVWSSIKEIRCGIEAIKKFNKPYLVGVHISEGNSLPSGEKISEINSIITENCLGVILACVSPENYENNLDEIQKLKVPFGFKLNGFITTKPTGGYTSQYKENDGSNPNSFLGQRKDLDPEKISIFAKKFKENGATILGGCCETRPSHIEAIKNII